MLGSNAPQTIFSVFEVDVPDEIPGLTVVASTNSDAMGDTLGIEGEGPASANSIALAAAGAWGYFLPAGVMPQPGDNNFDGLLDAGDIDNLNGELGGSGAAASQDSGPQFSTAPLSVFDGASGLFDVNQDQYVSTADRDYLIFNLLGTVYGDTDLNGAIDYTDWTTTLSNSGTVGGWAEGDSNGDGVVDNIDLRAIALLGDADLDGVVDGNDLLSVQLNFGMTGEGVLGDANADGNVDGNDLLTVQLNFGSTWSTPAVAVPEPFSTALIAVALVGGCLTRRVH